MTSKAYLQIAIASCTFYSTEFQTITREIFVLHFKLTASSSPSNCKQVQQTKSPFPDQTVTQPNLQAQFSVQIYTEKVLLTATVF